MKIQTSAKTPYSRRALAAAAASLALVLGLGPQPAPGTVQALPPAVGSPTAAPQVSAADAVDQLAEIMVEAPEPRYVAPTRRDQIGRIWAPVLINGRGPFRLVLDTGASSSGVTAMVALALGIPTDLSPPVMLRGVTGSATVPSIHVDTLSVGDLAVDSAVLPIVPDALGGAEGVLGSEGLQNKRIFIDFRHDQIAISYSRDERSGHGFVTVPFRLVRGQLIVIDALVGHVHAKAIIDERTKNGPFKDAGDLATRVKGIGTKSVTNLEAAGLTINGSSAPPSGVKAAPKSTSTASTKAAPAATTAAPATTAATTTTAAPADAASDTKKSKKKSKAAASEAAASAPAATTAATAAAAPADASGSKASKKKAKKSKAASAAAASS